MQVDLAATLCSPYATPDYLRLLGAAAEAEGFGGIWVGDHVLRFDHHDSRYPYTQDGRRPAWSGDGLLEPFSVLTFLASCTGRLRVGMGVLVLPQRNPVYVASQVASLDWLSDGRVDLGIGVGWSAEEFEAAGAAFERRGDRADDYLATIKALWCDDPSSHDGIFYQLPACRMYPKPQQKPHPPVHVGGNSAAALGRAARLGQGWYGLGLGPEATGEHVDRLVALLRSCGRRRQDVQVSMVADPQRLDAESVGGYAAAGVDRLLLRFRVPEPSDVEPTLESYRPVVEAASAF